MYKKIIIISALVLMTFVTGMKIISYHDENNIADIKSIVYISYLGEYERKEYLEKEDIEKIIKKLNCINFYPVLEHKLYESPTSVIYIETNNTAEKKIQIAGFYVRIIDYNGDVEMYVINPWKIRKIFDLQLRHKR